MCFFFFVFCFFCFLLIWSSLLVYSIPDLCCSSSCVACVYSCCSLIVVFVPTYCLESNSPVIDEICTGGEYPLLGHINEFKNTIHLIFASIFIFTMGWMSKYKFTRGEQTANNKIYKWCGNLVWLAIALLILLAIIDFFNAGFQITSYDVFFLESLALIPFGISWFIKGEAMEDIKELFN